MPIGTGSGGLKSMGDVRTPSGRTIVRQVNETSARDHGIEFHVKHGDEGRYGEGKSKIEGVYDKKPDISYSPTHHIQVLDSHDIAEVLDRHGEQIHRHLRDLSRSEQERSVRHAKC